MVEQNIVRGRNGPYHCFVHMWELNDVDVRDGPCHICVCMHLVYVCVVCGYMYMHTCIHIHAYSVWVCIRCHSTLFTGAGSPMFSNRPMWITLRVHEGNFPPPPPHPPPYIFHFIVF